MFWIFATTIYDGRYEIFTHVHPGILSSKNMYSDHYFLSDIVNPFYFDSWSSRVLSKILAWLYHLVLFILGWTFFHWAQIDFSLYLRNITCNVVVVKIYCVQISKCANKTEVFSFFSAHELHFLNKCQKMKIQCSHLKCTKIGITTLLIFYVPHAFVCIKFL